MKLMMLDAVWRIGRTVGSEERMTRLALAWKPA